MEYNYLVYGSGRQGTAAVYDLVKNCEAKHISVVDPDKEAIATANSRLTKLLGEDMKGVVFFHEDMPSNSLGGFHAALSCAPYRFNFELMEKTVEQKVPFCDLGGNPEVVAKQQAFSSQKNISAAPDCGVSPGLSNMIISYLVKTHYVDQVIVRCGGIPLNPSKKNPLSYKLTFDPAGLISEYSGKVPIIRNRKIEYIDALSSVGTFGEFECSPTSNNSPVVVKWLLDQGIKDYEYMTLRWPGHWAEVKKWKEEGYLCGDAEKDEELLERLRADKKLKYNPDTDRDRIIMSVVGYKDGALREQWGYSFDLHSDKETKFSAMEMTTSWGITIVAHHMAQRNEGFGGAGFTGVLTPEQFMDGGWVIGQLRKRMEGVNQC